RAGVPFVIEGRCMIGDESRDVDKIDVAYVARLARLDLTDDERRVFQEQLDHIVGYMRKIRELDLSGIEPTSHAHPVQNVFREDETRPGLPREEAMDNAPASADGQFIVPKILE
ncbi:Asp-tRNA(Asn)/Glu-tRNA(Gln) amidotransferase subunit GatC, partial [Verrucomicrobiota bacterium]